MIKFLFIKEKVVKYISFLIFIKEDDELYAIVVVSS